MTTPHELGEAPESFIEAFGDTQAAPSQEAESLFQEINERRARIENAELLSHLRGL